MRALLALLAALALGPSVASAASARSPLPGFPRFGGVVLVHDGAPASIAREKAIEDALRRQASGGAAAVAPSSNATTPDCATEAVNPGADLCYWGGPVLRSSTVHLIFWEGPEPRPTGVKAFSPEYIKKIEEYFTNVASADGSRSNVYAVSAQYGSTEGPGSYDVHFSAGQDVYVDTTHSLPAAGAGATQCEDRTKQVLAGVCVTGRQLQEEVSAALEANRAKGWESSPEDVNFVFTPAEVGSCFYSNGELEEGEANTCAFEAGGFCAYHSSFETEAEEPTPPFYANIPDNAGVEGCDSFEYPTGTGEVNATLDVTSHEENEAITDPEVGEGWTDVIGQEIGDKCLPPETFETYGEPLGGLPAHYNSEEELVPGTLFNQEIGSGEYWLQTEWSNRAGFGQGRCVQRMVPAEFREPAGAKATVPTTFEGAPSGEPSDPAAYWVWSFGDKVQVGTPEPTVSHTYATPGTYTVRLTVYDAFGNSNTFSRTVTVGAAPPPPPVESSTTTTTSTPSTTSLTTTRTVTTAAPEEPLAHYSSAALAHLLGLLGNGRRLSGLGRISLGHAQCPPACGVKAKILAAVRHGHRIRRITIGHLSETIAHRGSGSIALRLTGRGRRLLRRMHKLHVRLIVTVRDRQGGGWRITRGLTLTSAAKAAGRHRRGHASARRRTRRARAAHRDRGRPRHG